MSDRRVSDRSYDCARSRGLAPIAVVPCCVAVLDQLSDPGLRMDRDSAAERAAEPAVTRDRPNPGSPTVAEQRLFGRIGARIFLPAVYDPADLWQPIRTRR